MYFIPVNLLISIISKSCIFMVAPTVFTKNRNFANFTIVKNCFALTPISSKIYTTG